MKNLKTYENSVYKQYAIVQLNDHNKAILKILEVIPHQFQMKVQKLYLQDRNELIKYSFKPLSHDISISKTFEPNVIMQSDDLDELVDHMNMLINVEKYNL